VSRKKSSQYDLAAIMRDAWKLARAAAVAGMTTARELMGRALHCAWNDAKAKLALTRRAGRPLLLSSQLIGCVEEFGGRPLTVTAIRPWTSKDGYDKREYIECEFDGKIKKDLMYIFHHGQTDFFYEEIPSVFGRIFIHNNIELLLYH
jgi:hypothetical protein